MNIELTPTQEDYLMAIHHLEQEHLVARVGTISKALQVGLSSVTAALKTLAAKNLVNYSPHSYITLTSDGLSVSRRLAQRKTILTDFLHNTLTMTPADAERNAHRLEHAFDEEMLNRLVDFVNFINTCPRTGEKWIRSFSNHCNEQQNLENCEQCLEQCFEDFKQQQLISKQQSSIHPATMVDLKPGEKARVVNIRAATRRMVEMGIVPGAVISLEKIAPLGDPIEIRLKGFSLTLRKKEAAAIEVEMIDQ